MAEDMKTPEPNAKPYTEMAARVYDALYAGKDYEGEAKKLKSLIERFKKTDGNDLLDVACGTGLHLPYLVDDFSVTGVDLSEQQISQARQRLPDLRFVQADMRDFDLGKQYDVVTCLFSSIGYVYPYSEMQKAVENMSRHLKPGGVLIIEPWLSPDVFDPNLPPHTETGELPGLKVTRTPRVSLDGDVSVMNMEHVVETADGVHEFTEEHRLALYSTDQFHDAYTAAGLSFNQDEQGLFGRGLYIGVKPFETAA